MTGVKIVDYQGCNVDHTEGSMDRTTGKFTAKKRGLYRFHFHTMVHSNKNAYVSIKKGLTVLCTMGDYGNKDSTESTMSNSVITEMEVGEQVYVDLPSSGHDIYSSSNKYIVFEGFFLGPL